MSHWQFHDLDNLHSNYQKVTSLADFSVCVHQKNIPRIQAGKHPPRHSGLGNISTYMLLISMINVCIGYPRPTNSGKWRFIGGPFMKMSRLLFHWHRGWGIPPNVCTCTIPHGSAISVASPGWWQSRVYIFFSPDFQGRKNQVVSGRS